MNVAIMTGILVISLLAGGLTNVQAQTQDPFETEEANMTTPYDPWEAVNQPVFTFNLKLDEYLFRPVATGYDILIPDAGQRSVDRFFKNLGILPRFANSLFQGKLGGASREVGRFAVNTTLGGLACLMLLTICLAGNPAMKILARHWQPMGCLLDRISCCHSLAPQPCGIPLDLPSIAL